MLTGLLMVSVAPMFAAQEPGMFRRGYNYTTLKVNTGIDMVGERIPFGGSEKYREFAGEASSDNGSHRKPTRLALGAAIAGTAYYTVKGAVKLVKGAYNWITKEEEVVQEEVVVVAKPVEPAPVVEEVAQVVTQTPALTAKQKRAIAVQARKAARRNNKRK